MHVVTFYSFKGGVGRTMALVNVAAELTARGRRVLVVDFDLEAPGIQTYQPFASAEGTSMGLVDYITNYIQSRKAPKASDYIVEREIDGKPIWLMPAGAQDDSYGRRLNSIDWLTLYNDFNGYLMFEDLKQQWREMNFNYVLIDSRTGHTDVGGICTRQLCDANVLMFSPNDQNLSGMEEVVRTIRLEEKNQKKQIRLHFCPSNIPDIDDEYDILERHLNDSMRRLSYKMVASILHHYESLELLDQPIFVLKRPKSRLADEYRKLVDEIAAGNLEDKSGALARLEQVRSSIRAQRGVVDLAETELLLAQIYTSHKDDGEVAWALSNVYEMIGNFEAQLDTLGTAISHGVNEPRARTKRAMLLLRGEKSDVARDDLRAALRSPDISVADFVNAFDLFREVDANWLETIENAGAIGKLRGRELNRVAEELMTDRRGAELAAKLLANEEQSNIRVLALIGSGQYASAMEVIGERTKVLASDEITDVFNFACAEWGLTGRAPSDLFARVVEMGGNEEVDGDANFPQCLAISCYTINEIESARRYSEQAAAAVKSMPPVKVFSAWRYLNVNREGLGQDIDAMQEQMKVGSMLVPEWRRSTLVLM